MRWLLESYDDEELKAPVRALLAEFCGLKKGETIKSVETLAQRYHIDISVRIETDERSIALFIEDKTFSFEHEQLQGYNRKIGAAQGAEVRKIFYKTSPPSDSDLAAAKKAGREAYDLNRIYLLFQPYSGVNNLIFQQYVAHLKKLHCAANSDRKPQTSDSREDWLSWETYFKRVVFPHIREKYRSSWVGCAGRHPYAYLAVKEEENMPYLEIRSRDCCENRFTALILCYGVTDSSPQGRAIDRIKRDMLFSCKHLRHKNGNAPKQIGKYTAENVDTDQKFIAEVLKCAQYYSLLMKVWRGEEL